MEKRSAVRTPIGQGGDDSHPFGLPWLDSCYQQTLLPQGPWEKVRDKISEDLAARVAKQLDHPERRQALLELLGAEFVQKYFPNQEYNPTLLEPPQMSAEEKKKLQSNAQNWLRNQVNQAAAEVKCHRVTEADSINQCQEMVDFLQHTYRIFTTGLDRHLYLLEGQIRDEVDKEQHRQHKKKEEIREAQERQQQWQQQRQRGVRSILKNSNTTKPPPTASSIVTTMSERDRRTTANVKGAMHGLKGDPPMFWSMESNSVGRSILALIKRDPRRLKKVVAKLHGRQLPGTLRSYVWMDMLLKKERDLMKEANAEKVVRERFGKAVTRGMTELKIKRATHSPISGLIDNAVIEIYHATPSMLVYLDDDLHLKQAAKALNVLYVYDRSYEPYLIYWLFPLQLAYIDHAEDVDHVYDLAMYLELLNQNCYPKWPQIFAIADQAMIRLRDGNPRLYSHLKSVAQVEPIINPKEFLVHLIHQEKEKGEAIMRAKPGSDSSMRMSEELLADPLIFLRKWVGEGFVGVLDTQAVLFVWDQFFMQQWAPRALEDLCLALLLLLEHKFLDTTNYKSMKDAFLLEPCKLYTMDIQRAWVHLQNGGPLHEVPPINRQRPRTPEPLPELDQTGSVTPAAMLQSLDPVGIKNIRVKLYFPPQAVQQEKWLESLRATDIRLTCSIFFGSVKLRSKHSVVLPVYREGSPDSYGGRHVRLEFHGEKFEFEDIDPSQYDVEREMGGYPYAIIRVDYLPKDSHRTGAHVTLGWARIKLFQQDSLQARSERNPWIIMKGDCSYALHSGAVSEAITGHTTPAFKQGENDILGRGSELSARVYDPREGQPSPSPRPVRTPQQNIKQPSPKPAPVRPTPQHNTPQPTQPRLDTNRLFDFYVDTISNIPDSATVVKVTGRFIKTGEVTGTPDILALPQMSSSARSPGFLYQLPVNAAKQEMSRDALVLLRLYTADSDTKELAVIGSCLFELFDKDTGNLRVGGHEKYLRHGMPDLSQGMNALTSTSMDDNPIIPGCSICIRLLPHSGEYESKPDVPLVYYQLDEKSKWNISQERVIDSYKRELHYPPTVRETVNRLREEEKLEPLVGDRKLLQWVEERLDHKRQKNQPARDCDLGRVVSYRRTMGLNIRINKAYGLPEGLHVYCFARMSAGKKTLGTITDIPDEKLITEKYDYDSLQKAPVFKDQHKTVHPFLDQYTVLLVQIFGLNIKYLPTEDHEAPGTVADHNGAELVELGEDTVLGWAVVPLFNRSCVTFGDHHVPIFKGAINEDLLEKFTEDTIENVITGHRWTPQTKFESAGLEVSVWDAHFEREHHPAEIQREDSLLGKVGSVDRYRQSENETQGKKISEFVVNSLERKYQKDGTSGAIYIKEREFHEQVVGEKFYELMENALMNAGYGPL